MFLLWKPNGFKTEKLLELCTLYFPICAIDLHGTDETNIDFEISFVLFCALHNTTHECLHSKGKGSDYQTEHLLKLLAAPVLKTGSFFFYLLHI